MKVYRIEHRTDESQRAPFFAGPYGIPYCFGNYQNLSDEKHPCPHDEGLRVGSQHIFAFPTLEAMWAWFSNGDAAQLSSWNFVVRVYESEHVQASKTQCVISSVYPVRLVETAELEDLFDF